MQKTALSCSRELPSQPRKFRTSVAITHLNDHFRNRNRHFRACSFHLSKPSTWITKDNKSVYAFQPVSQSPKGEASGRKSKELVDDDISPEAFRGDRAMGVSRYV